MPVAPRWAAECRLECQARLGLQSGPGAAPLQGQSMRGQAGAGAVGDGSVSWMQQQPGAPGAMPGNRVPAECQVVPVRHGTTRARGIAHGSSRCRCGRRRNDVVDGTRSKSTCPGMPGQSMRDQGIMAGPGCAGRVAAHRRPSRRTWRSSPVSQLHGQVRSPAVLQWRPRRRFRRSVARLPRRAKGARSLLDGTTSRPTRSVHDGCGAPGGQGAQAAAAQAQAQSARRMRLDQTAKAEDRRPPQLVIRPATRKTAWTSIGCGDRRSRAEAKSADAKKQPAKDGAPRAVAWRRPKMIWWIPTPIAPISAPAADGEDAEQATDEEERRG